ncbi:hypothetical protein [Haloplanus aerogenes]|uniref:DUF885 domain-containing protein n=1 Tax=Haloplanus aerogenes TaxID=660522 RepID=A0A3M0CQ51_9EURY|nr:hypothetical protein [Haloplanus aerogenes]AZH25928.1 hypothetical protein DU502_11325 [Haloplanus aerogenes]RMB11622.1 hypothetical protein ATH50_3316 [Haloplanus aerogenes]
MSRHTRRSLLAATGTAFIGTLAGCSELNPLSSEETVEYDESALATLPSDLPRMAAAIPVQPTSAHLTSARERVHSLLEDPDTEISEVPNGVVRHRLARERDSARAALAQNDDESTRIDALAGLTYPRSEAMFVHAGLAAFDGDLTAADIAARRDRHHHDAGAFLDDYRYVGPSDDPVGALTEHARIVGWGRTGIRLTEANRRHEYENTVLHVAELAQNIEWGRAYTADARRLREHYVATLNDQRDYGNRFSRVADTLVSDIDSHVDAPDREALMSGVERNIENTVAAKLLEELARSRWSGAKMAVEDHDDGRDTLAIVSAMRALAADRALADAMDIISDGAYSVPESIDPIEAERTAAVEELRALLDTSPALLARRLAVYARNPIRNADRDIREDTVSSPGRYLYAQYAVANRFAAAAPAIVRRVGDVLVA